VETASVRARGSNKQRGTTTTTTCDGDARKKSVCYCTVGGGEANMVGCAVGARSRGQLGCVSRARDRTGHVTSLGDKIDKA
jgi:hypothetical protein